MRRASFLFLIVLMLSSKLATGQEANLGSKNNIKSSILVLSQDELFKRSLPGIELLKIFEKRQASLFTEARRIEQDFILEEKKLTEQRLLLDKEDFQILADNFDKKVEKMRNLRAEQDKRLQKDFINWRKKFLQIALPFIRNVMSDFNALIVLESKNRGLVYDQKIDVTENIIKLLNAEFLKNPQLLSQILASE